MFQICSNFFIMKPYKTGFILFLAFHELVFIWYLMATVQYIHFSKITHNTKIKQLNLPNI